MRQRRQRRDRVRGLAAAQLPPRARRRQHHDGCRSWARAHVQDQLGLGGHGAERGAGRAEGCARQACRS